MGRRALTAAGVLGAALALQASCVAVFGVDEPSLHNVVAEMCQCDSLQALDGCEATLTARLDGAGGAAQQAWLAHYVDKCLECKDALLCLSESPTCTLSTCKLDAECCQVSTVGATICFAGSCKACSVGACTQDVECCQTSDAGKVKCVDGSCT